MTINIDKLEKLINDQIDHIDQRGDNSTYDDAKQLLTLINCYDMLREY